MRFTFVRRVVLALVLTTGLAVIGSCGGDEPVASATVDKPDAIRLVGENGDRGYSMASIHDGIVWTAGHLPESATEGDPIARQTEVVMEDLKATLKEAGAGFDTVVMTNVYLANLNDWPEFNEVYKRYFDAHLPPRVTVQAALGFGAIEISMIAHVRST